MDLKYSPIHETSTRFHRSNKFARWLMGPIGCLAPDTLILTEYGAIPISRIDRPMRVLSWNEKTCRFQLSWCAGAFPRGKDYLYRVVTPEGEFDAAAGHLLLCADGTYRRVENLAIGDEIASYLPGLHPTTEELSQQVSRVSDLRSKQIDVGCLGDYGALVRQCGQQLLQELSNVQVFVPSPAGVQGYDQGSFLEDILRADDPQEPSQTRSQMSKHADHLGKKRYDALSGNEPEVGEGFGVSGFFGRVAEKFRGFVQSQQSLYSRQLTQLRRYLLQWSQVYGPCSSPKDSVSTSHRPIIHIERRLATEVYWDIQVETTHNYVTVDGAVHHNCGKSYAIMWEILIRAAQQPVGPTGKRRSRVILVRNTRQMLLDAVLPILKEVLPEGIIGTWKSSESVYQVRVNDIECDILLRPLEDDNDIRRVLGINATFCAVDEWREIPVSTVIQIAGRAGRFPAKEEEGCAYAGIFGASNPPVEDSDWHETLEVKRPDGWELFQFPSALSPEATWRQYLRDGYYENLMEGGTKDYIRVMIEGMYGRSLDGRAVYEDTFNHEFHVAKESLIPLEYGQYPVIIGMDFGRTPAAAIGQRDSRGRVLLLDELYVENIGLERFLEYHLKPKLNERFPRNKYIVVGDPAGWAKSQLNEESVADVLRRAGFHAVKAPTNDPDARIRSVEKLLAQQTDGKASFLIDPRCKNAIRGFNGGYKYKRKNDGTYESSPKKDENSHLADAIQYMTLGIDLNGGSGGTKKRDVKPAPMRIV